MSMLDQTQPKKGSINLPEKKIEKFLRKRINNFDALLLKYKKDLESDIMNKETKLKKESLFFDINKKPYFVLGKFSEDTLLVKDLENNFEYETKTSLVEEAFGLRNFDTLGNVIIPKLSQIELTNFKTLKSLEEKEMLLYKDWKGQKSSNWTEFYVHNHNEKEISPRTIENLKIVVKQNFDLDDDFLLQKIKSLLRNKNESIKNIKMMASSDMKEFTILTEISTWTLKIKRPSVLSIKNDEEREI